LHKDLHLYYLLQSYNNTFPFFVQLNYPLTKRGYRSMPAAAF